MYHLHVYYITIRNTLPTIGTYRYITYVMYYSIVWFNTWLPFGNVLFLKKWFLRNEISQRNKWRGKSK